MKLTAGITLSGYLNTQHYSGTKLGIDKKYAAKGSANPSVGY